jgi:hypothetical protein
MDYPTYRAVIRTAEDDQAWGRDGLRASAVGSIQAVIVDVPAKVLSRGRLRVEPRQIDARRYDRRSKGRLLQRQALNPSLASPEMFWERLFWNRPSKNGRSRVLSFT